MRLSIYKQFLGDFAKDFFSSKEFGDIVLNNPLDMHLHLREGEMLESVLPFSAKSFVASLVMPNLKNPLTNTDLAINYQDKILELAHKSAIRDFVPIVSLYLTESLSKDELKKAKSSGLKILKLYPRGATTGSESGVKEVFDERLLEVLAYAQDLGFMLSIHGESTGYCLDREFEFLEVFRFLAKTFPKLKIVIEHISDSRSLALLEEFENLYGTLTLHHILLSLDDVMGGALRPDLFCKPMLKSPKDRDALLQTALSAHPKIAFGSDSAPHLSSQKYSSHAPGGIFSAPIVLSVLASVFAYFDKLPNLQSFVSDNAMGNYGLKDFINSHLQAQNIHNNKKTLTLKNEIWEIPESVSCGNDSISVLFGGLKCGFKEYFK